MLSLIVIARRSSDATSPSGPCRGDTTPSSASGATPSLQGSSQPPLQSWLHSADNVGDRAELHGNDLRVRQLDHVPVPLGEDASIPDERQPFRHDAVVRHVVDDEELPERTVDPQLFLDLAPGRHPRRFACLDRPARDVRSLSGSSVSRLRRSRRAKKGALTNPANGAGTVSPIGRKV